jgi:hypothetical protein
MLVARALKNSQLTLRRKACYFADRTRGTIDIKESSSKTGETNGSPD